ncbi:hypothetical protein [Rhizobium leguminosarum]|uniref:hypothetical protein n=1 Tax=Rhizobium leguminosarum TaxID=384 RepID=UPI001CDD3071|nr:hypothetical protein [Rhizobium leguminosarum]MCA2411303.1 hypothetical protein [Rhizobium leguminosarum]
MRNNAVPHRVEGQSGASVQAIDASSTTNLGSFRLVEWTAATMLASSPDTAECGDAENNKSPARHARCADQRKTFAGPTWGRELVAREREKPLSTGGEGSNGSQDAVALIPLTEITPNANSIDLV